MVKNFKTFMLKEDSMKKAADTARATEPIDPFAYQQVQGKGMDVSWRETASGKSLYHSDVKKGLRRLEYPMSVSE